MFDLHGWLTKLSAEISTVGAVVAAIAAILSSVNKAKLERIDSQVKTLELRSKTEQASREYADIFIKQVLSEESAKKNEKRVQALLSILNIVAQASGSDEGASSAKTRAMTPVVLALLLGEPGGVAQMDEDYRFLDDWVAIACADNSRKTRVTAIQALCGICQKALRAGRLDVVVKGVRAVDQLLALIPKPDDPKDADYFNVLAARSQLASFIKKEDRLVHLAKDPDLKATLGSPEQLRAEIRNAFSDANLIVQDTKATLEATVKNLESKTDPAKEDPDAKKQLSLVKNNLAQLDAALANASQVAVVQITQNPTPKPSAGASAASPGPTPAGTPDALSGTIANLLGGLQDNDAQIRRRSRSQLAVLGQSAVKPMLEEVARRFGKNGEEDYRLRLGVATALYVMTQPITLDETDAYWTVSLLRSNDGETRRQASEFLMNLEHSKTIQYCFDELEKLFYELSVSPKDGGNAVINAAVIVGTWARNLTPQTLSRVPGLSMPQVALETAKDWREVLKKSSAAQEWGSTINTLNQLISRAEAVQQKNQAVTALTPK